MLDHGANRNARDNGGSTPLHSLINGYAGAVEATHLLLKYGAIIDSEDDHGRTPLQLALEHDREDIATCRESTALCGEMKYNSKPAHNIFELVQACTREKVRKCQSNLFWGIFIVYFGKVDIIKNN